MELLRYQSIKGQRMKIVFVDDDYCYVRGMMSAAKSAGHEVLGVTTNRFLKWEDCCSTRELDVMVCAIKDFNPDFVFLDHDLCLRFSGKDIAELIGFPCEKLVGTSYGGRQDYCRWYFEDKVWSKYPHFPSILLAFLASLQV